MALTKIKTSNITDDSVTNSKIADDAVQTENVASTVNLGRRNLIINGDMRIAQRGTTPVTGNEYLIDRWKQVRVLSSATVEMSQSTDVPTAQGFYNSIKLNVTSAGALSAGNYHRIDTRLEGQNLQHIKWGTASPEKLTLSFWVKSNYTGSLIATLNPTNGTTNSISFTVNSADTWEKKTLTFTDTTSTAPMANDNTNQLSLYFYSAVGSSTFTETLNNYINITGVQLEVGDTATPFEHRSFGEELSLCQRYYQKSYPYTAFAGTNQASGCHSFIPINKLDDVNVRFTQNMRATPTITTYRKNGSATSSAQRSDNTANYMTITVADIRDNSFQFNPGSSVSRSYRIHYIADAEL